MNKTVLGWLKIIGAAASAAGAVLAAATPITGPVILLAVFSGLTAAGTTASALYQEKPDKGQE